MNKPIKDSDYFYRLSDARGRLAACQVHLEWLVNAIEGGSQIHIDSAMKVAKDHIEELTEFLEKPINAER